MRATIKFEADVEKVRNIMYSLILEETHALGDAINCMESMGDATSDRLIEGISESLGHVQGVARQLEQYRSMILSFEKARLETILPTPQAEGRDNGPTVVGQSGFDNFVERMATPENDNGGNDAKPEER
tara:strand:- start:6389 stop:6775 length:387 start_codon:yes stop_codon:yes gene_type:complete